MKCFFYYSVILYSQPILRYSNNSKNGQTDKISKYQSDYIKSTVIYVTKYSILQHYMYVLSGFHTEGGR